MSKIILCVVVWVVFVLFFVEAEGEWVSGFVVGVEGIRKILVSVIIEAPEAGNGFPGFLGDLVAKDSAAILRSVCSIVFLEFFEAPWLNCCLS